MSFAKRAMERDYTRIDETGFGCGRCHDEEAAFRMTDGNGTVELLCHTCVDRDGHLCPKCEDQPISNEEIPNDDFDGSRVVCTGCAEAWWGDPE